MRKLNWTKLPDMKVKGTVWEESATDDHEARQIDTAELEELFGTKAKEAKGTPPLPPSPPSHLLTLATLTPPHPMMTRGRRRGRAGRGEREKGQGT